MVQRLPGLRGVVARVRRKPPPGIFPGSAALTGATRCGRPGKAQAATREAPRWRCAYRGYEVCGSPGQAQAATRDAPPVALRLPGLRGVVARVRRKPRPGMFPGGAYRGYEVWSPGSGASRNPGYSPGSAALTGATGCCGRPGQAQAATRDVPRWRCAYRGYRVCSPGQAQAATRDVPPVALRLPGLRGVW